MATRVPTSCRTSGQVEAQRDAAERKKRARVSIRLAVAEAPAAGMSAEEDTKAFAEVRERGLFGTAGEVNTARKPTR